MPYQPSPSRPLSLGVDVLQPSQGNLSPGTQTPSQGHLCLGIYVDRSVKSITEISVLFMYLCTSVINLFYVIYYMSVVLHGCLFKENSYRHIMVFITINT